LLIATWMVRILKQNVPYHDNDRDNTHPYTDFMMNAWWDVKTFELLKDGPGAFAEAIALESTLKQLCQESHSYLQQALPEQYRESPWVTPLAMARLIGSLEQNCLGIRRKHAVHRILMEDTEFRREVHQELIKCLEQAGMIGGDDEADNDDSENDDNNQDDFNSSDKCVEEGEEGGSYGQNGRNVNFSNGEETDDEKEQTRIDVNGQEIDNAIVHETTENESPGPEEDWDYSYDDIAEFLAGFSTHLKTDITDEWDEIIRPLDGTAHFTIATKMNHSCDPNVILLYKTRGWGRDHPLVAYCIALKDISEGEELTICYIDSSESYEKRQEALANYGFTCACSKCEKEKNGSKENKGFENRKESSFDEEDLFGSDDDDDDDVSKGGGESTGDKMSAHSEEVEVVRIVGDDSNQLNGETKLLNLAEQVDSAFNKSIHGAIPIGYLAPVSNYVVKLASKILRDVKESKMTMLGLLKQCANAIESRDFASCRVVGADLELYLYNQLKLRGSWPDISFRACYWCASTTASIGHAHDGSFLVAMKYLDRGVILGLNRQELEGFVSYVETFASQMAHGPCPQAVTCTIPDFCDPELQELLACRGLCKPIEFPVNEIPCDGGQIEKMLASGSQTSFVIRRMALEWPAVTKWRAMETLCREHGHRLIPIEVGSMRGGMQEAVVTFRHFIAKYLSASTKKDCWSLLDATNKDNSRIAYLAQHPLLDQIPALYADVERTPCGTKPTNVNLWVGTGGTRTPLHYDSYDNLFVQLVGAKYVRLYAREDTPKLYVSKDKSYGLQGNMSEVDCEMEDFDKHPMAKDCAFQEVLLLPGDCLFIPSRCWHYVRSLSTSVSINYWF